MTRAETVARAFKICGDLRCVVTGHLVGTDTWVPDVWCQCDSCGTVKKVSEALVAFGREAEEERDELVRAMDEAEPRLQAEHDAVEAARPFVNLCRQWYDGTNLIIQRAAQHQDEPLVGDLLRNAALALDAAGIGYPERRRDRRIREAEEALRERAAILAQGGWACGIDYPCPHDTRCPVEVADSIRALPPGAPDAHA